MITWKKKKNELQKKLDIINELSEQSEDAVGLVTKTINRLEDINEQVLLEMSNIKNTIDSYQVMNDMLSETMVENSALIRNFRKLLEV